MTASMRTTATTDTRSARQAMLAIACTIAILATTLGVHQAIGQSSQQDLADHPLIGAWVLDPEASDPSNPPSYDAFMANGTVINVGSDGTSIGTWEATGPRTANFTFSGLAADSNGAAMFIIRGTLEVDETGERLKSEHTFTLVGADGTVIMSAKGGSGEGVRLHTETMDALDQPLANFPTWTPAEATPAA